jgi:hypothetical protein
MLPFFGGDLMKMVEMQVLADTKNMTLEKFVKLFLETQMTFWFARFHIPQEYFETTMFNALARAQEAIDNDELKDLPFGDISPIVFGMISANDPLIDEALDLFDGTPVTAEKLEEAGVKSIKRVLTATHLYKQLGF